MLRERVPLYELDCRAVVGLLLLRRRQGREVLTRHLQLHPALDLHPPWVLPDALDVERLLLHEGQCTGHLGVWRLRLWCASNNNNNNNKLLLVVVRQCQFGNNNNDNNNNQCQFGARANQPVPLAASGLFSVGVGLALPVPV